MNAKTLRKQERRQAAAEERARRGPEPSEPYREDLFGRSVDGELAVILKAMWPSELEVPPNARAQIMFRERLAHEMRRARLRRRPPVTYRDIVTWKAGWKTEWWLHGLLYTETPFIQMVKR